MDMIEKWTVFRLDITPKTLRIWANRLEADMNNATIGDELPRINVKDHNSKTELQLIADQGAWHNRKSGQWI
jgi:hypothetical protein